MDLYDVLWLLEKRCVELPVPLPQGATRLEPEVCSDSSVIRPQVVVVSLFNVRCVQ